jgi:hypothetical protein
LCAASALGLAFFQLRVGSGVIERCHPPHHLQQQQASYYGTVANFWALQKPSNETSNDCKSVLSQPKIGSSPSTVSSNNRAMDNTVQAASIRNASSRVLLRLDDAAPRIRYAVTHYLVASIPAGMRLPADRAANDTLLYADPFLNQRRYVFEFNPSIVVLPPNQRTVPGAA